MSDQLIVVLGAIGLIVVVLAVTAIRWGRGRSVRALLHGIGLALIIGALWIVGFLALVLTWARATVHWVRQTPFDTVRLVGACVAGVGVLVVIIGSAISPVSRAEAKQRRLDRREKLRAAQAASTATSSPRPSNAGVGKTVEPIVKSPAAATTTSTTTPSDSDDAEIKDILRRRGIQ